MTELVGALAVAIVAWFAAGTIWNVRKGSALMRWMHDGLPVLGERTTVRWLGSTAAEMTMREAKAPFGAVTVVIFLEARDLPWMWALGRARGRRDTLIVRGTLRREPRLEFEALDPTTWSGREALPRVPSGWPIHQPAATGGLVVHGPDAAAIERSNALLAFAGGAGVVRLSVRGTEPHFQIHVVLPDGRRGAREFFETIRTLGERALT